MVYFSQSLWKADSIELRRLQKGKKSHAPLRVTSHPIEATETSLKFLVRTYITQFNLTLQPKVFSQAVFQSAESNLDLLFCQVPHDVLGFSKY
jgi:hypothetical protein